MTPRDWLLFLAGVFSVLTVQNVWSGNVTVAAIIGYVGFLIAVIVFGMLYRDRKDREDW